MPTQFSTLTFPLIAEAPYFVKRPEDTVAMAGADVTLDCQVRGEDALAYCQICGVIQIHHLFWI